LEKEKNKGQTNERAITLQPDRGNMCVDMKGCLEKKTNQREEQSQLRGNKEEVMGF